MNAKEEFIEHVAGLRVLCTEVKWSRYEDENNLDRKSRIKYTKPKDYHIQHGFLKKHFTMRVNYSDEDYQNFIDSLDFTYNNDYGTQEISGKIWYTDGTWSERREYDGSEWWEYFKLPEIPENLR